MMPRRCAMIFYFATLFALMPCLFAERALFWPRHFIFFFIFAMIRHDADTLRFRADAAILMLILMLLLYFRRFRRHDARHARNIFDAVTLILLLPYAVMPCWRLSECRAAVIRRCLLMPPL